MQVTFTDDPSTAAPALVSCLCVTDDRSSFHPWLAWNYEKQDHRERELVVVSAAPDVDSRLRGCPRVRHVPCPPGTSIARKRNLAVAAARGEIVAWFDDDDWQHPRRLSLLVAALADGDQLAGPVRSWFVDLARGRARAHGPQRGVIFNGLGVRRAALAGVRFDELRSRAADTPWVAALRRAAARPPVVLPHVLSFWLCHRDNVSNPASRYAFREPLGAVREEIGPDHWGDTDAQLAALRESVTVNHQLIYDAEPDPRKPALPTRPPAEPKRSDQVQPQARHS